MSSLHLNDLPPEVIKSVLTNLPIRSLISFSRTSHYSHVLAINALGTLELAVFPKKVHCMLAFLENHCHDDDGVDDGQDVVDTHRDNNGNRDGFHHLLYRQNLLTNDDDENDSEEDDFNTRSFTDQKITAIDSDSDDTTTELYQIALTTPPPPWCEYNWSYPINSGHSFSHEYNFNSTSEPDPFQPRPTPPNASSVRTYLLTQQNTIASAVLSSPTLQNLRSLTFHSYSLHLTLLANILASKLPNLHHLHLNFTHPYINDTSLSGNYWRATPGNGCGSPIWNAFGGIGSANAAQLKLTRLRSLTLRRAAITSTQMRRWIERNPELRNLTLEKVRGVDGQFVDWLSGYISRNNNNNGGSSDRSSKIEKIALIDCNNLVATNERDFEWIQRIVDSTASADDRGARAPTTSTDKAIHIDHDPNTRSLFRPPPKPSVKTPSSVLTLKELSLRSCAHVSDQLFTSLARGESITTRPRRDFDPVVNGDVPTRRNHRSAQITAVVLRREGDGEMEATRDSGVIVRISDGESGRRGWAGGIGRLVSPGGTVIT